MTFDSAICQDFVFAAPLARLFHQWLATGIVPCQWKTADTQDRRANPAERLPANIDH